MYECRRAAYIYFTQLKFLQIYGWNVLYTAIEKNSFIAHAGWACSRCDFVEVAAQVAHLYKKLSFTCLLLPNLTWEFHSTRNSYAIAPPPVSDCFKCPALELQIATDALQINSDGLQTSYKYTSEIWALPNHANDSAIIYVHICIMFY